MTSEVDQKTKLKKSKPDKKKKLADALRDNLKRRKARSSTSSNKNLKKD